MVDIYVAPDARREKREGRSTRSGGKPNFMESVGKLEDKEPIVSAAKKETRKTRKIDTKREKTEGLKLKSLEAIVKEKTRNPLAAFMAKPANLQFETQERQEKIVLLLRRHPITNLFWLITALAMILFPRIFFQIIPLEFIPGRYKLVMIISWYLLTFAIAFEKFLSWFFNVGIITDERIIDIDFPSVLYRDISATKVDRIEDVTIRVGGFVRSIFNYGDVLIQTAGTVPEIAFEAVPHPGRVAEVLNDLILEEEQERLDGRVR